MNQLFKHLRAPLGALFFLLFAGCSGKTSAPHWKHSSIRSLCPSYTTIRATYTTAEVCRNLQLEVKTNSERRRATLNTFAVPFAEAADSPGMTHVTIEAGNSSQNFLAYRLLGGQRLLFGDMAADWICSTLDNGQTMTITVGDYRGTITPSGWQQNL